MAMPHPTARIRISHWAAAAAAWPLAARGGQPAQLRRRRLGMLLDHPAGEPHRRHRDVRPLSQDPLRS